MEPINTSPLQQFIQQVNQADRSRAKEIRVPIDQAKSLAFTLGIVMSRLHGDLEKLVAESNSQEETIEVQLDGGSGF